MRAMRRRTSRYAWRMRPRSTPDSRNSTGVSAKATHARRQSSHSRIPTIASSFTLSPRSDTTPEVNRSARDSMSVVTRVISRPTA